MSLPRWRRLNRSFSTPRRSRSSTWAPPPRWRPVLEALEGRLLPSTYTVTSTDDAGPGSLRQAILDSNGNLGPNTIAFNIGSGGVQTIAPTSALPTITAPVVIDGATQPGYAGSPLIVLTGSNAGSNASGLVLAAAGCTVRGLVINTFAVDGISIQSAGDVIAGNFIGTDGGGTRALGNGRDGVHIAAGQPNTTVGGTVAGTRNLLSGNASDGLFTAGDNTLVQGNYLGTDVTGTQALPNHRDGVEVFFNTFNTTVGGEIAGAGNLISGNTADGVASVGFGTVVEGSFIGTDLTGTAALGNGNDGVDLASGADDSVGGTPAGARNLISANRNDGVALVGSDDQVVGNYIGTDVTGTHRLGNNRGLYIPGADNTIGGTVAGAGNLISGNGTYGVEIAGIVASGNRVVGNSIGTDVTGMAALPNTYGVYIADGSSNTIGGTVAGAGNLISGNFEGVVIFFGTSGGNELVQGNTIGTNGTGTRPLPNTVGLVILSGSANTVGGTTAGAGNLLSGNTGDGVEVFSSGNILEGNTIGTDVTGTAALGNGGNGVFLAGADNTVGGTAAGAGNIISANQNAGINLLGIMATGNLIQGNLVGTNRTGTARLANNEGVQVNAGVAHTTIGGTVAGARNVISANTIDGISVVGTGTLVQGNYVGTDTTGAVALSNAGDGVRIGFGAGSTTIGGALAGAGNLISGNSNAGVEIIGIGPNLVQGNFIGTDRTGTARLGNGVGVKINSSGNTVGGAAAGAGNLISGNSLGVQLANSISVHNVVQGNRIGTDVTGTVALGNGSGVFLSGQAQNNTIGGVAPGAGNLISGNAGDGLYANNSGGNKIAGNLIGTDITGTRALGNDTGVDLSGSGNTVGGTTPGARNLISGNRNLGLNLLGRNHVVVGNYIGTDVTGTAALANGFGLYVSAMSGITIGAAVPGAGNLISGNQTDGIWVASGTGTVIQGNLIGTDASGLHALGNGGTGISITSGSNDTIGGAAPGAGNVISGNHGTGLDLRPGNALVQGNSVGTNITGTQAIPNSVGMSLGGSNTTVGGEAAGAGNLISGNTNEGLIIGPGLTGFVIEGNRIGTDVTGTLALGNARGLLLNGNGNTVGGTTAGARNLISGNAQAGLTITGFGNQLLGNYIGTDVTGTTSLGNQTGILISGSTNTVGGTAAGARNVISGNRADGINITGTDTVIQGNYIGTDANGAKALGNINGVTVSAARATIGGTIPGAGNLISGNNGEGVAVNSGRELLLQGNLIGTDITGALALGNHNDGVFLSGSGITNALIGGTASGARNVIAGNTSGITLLTGANSNTIQGNYIGTDRIGTQALGNAAYAILLQGVTDNLIGGTEASAGNVLSGNHSGVLLNGSSDNRVQGNLIGTDASGTVALGNYLGLSLAAGAFNNLIGGTTAGAGNVISANQSDGVQVFMGPSGNLLQGNYIGTDVSGTRALGNGYAGVQISYSDGNTVGGTESGAGNLISGNQLSGVDVEFSTGNTAQGNRIGTDVTGTVALGNLWGVAVLGSDILVGGTAAGAGNLISGNREYGVYLSSARNVSLFGNRIGTDASGTLALGNGSTGVFFLNGQNITVGGTAAGAGNLISGNLGDGILIPGTGIAVQGNFIGTDASGMRALGNGGNGVSLTSFAHGNTIGGTSAGAWNTIAFNGHDGVLVDTGTGNAIRRNSIFASGNLGIELINNGNNGQAYPVLTSATSDRTSTTITGTLASAPSTTYTVEFFADTVCNPSGYGEGERFLGSTTVTTDAGGNTTFSFTVAIPVEPGQFVAATATDPAGNTSQFSACAQVTGPGAQGVVLLGLALPLTPDSPPAVAAPPVVNSAGLDQYFTAVLPGTGAPVQALSEAAPLTLPDGSTHDANAVEATGGWEGSPLPPQEDLWTW